MAASDLTIRVAGPDDGAPCAAIYAPVVTHGLATFEVAPPDAAAMGERIAEILATHPWLVAERGGEVVGYAYASPHKARAGYRWSADVSAYVAENARGQGVGRALYEPLLRLLVAQRLHNAYAGIALPNAASVGLHEGLGFQPVGVYRKVGFKLGFWLDVGWWGLRLSPEPAIDGPAPEEPIPFAALRARPEFDELFR